MSDDEMPAMGENAEFPEDDFDAGEDPAPLRELPEGVTKEILTPAASSEWKKPKTGDEVTVHYVGTLQSDSSQFDSSRDRGTPFVFTLGKGQVIKGWDLGVATMKKGEVAKFTLAPEFAYGEAGSPPKIPEKATLVFEVELIGWSSKDDLFGDEGVVKTQTKEGSGWKKPKEGDEVRCTLRAVAADGTALEERLEVEYALGSGAFGPLSKVADKALTSMKKGEEASLKCSKEYFLGDQQPDGGVVEIVLHELYETKDVSLSKDRSLMKKQVKEGDGWDTPKDAAKVTLKVEAATDGESPLPAFEPKTLELVCGNGEVSDALECAVLDMKKGERAVLTCTRPSLCADERLGLTDLGALQRVVLTLELTDFEKPRDTWDMSEQEKLDFAAARKEVGSRLFKEGRTEMALERYKKVVDLFSYIDKYAEDTKAKAKELKRVCELNKAACLLKLQRHQDAKTACNTVLKDEASNVKALFRRAQADFGLQDYGACLRDLKRVLELDPQNRLARSLTKQAAACQKEEDLKVKGLFAKMCKGIAVPGRKADVTGGDVTGGDVTDVKAEGASEDDAAKVGGAGADAAGTHSAEVQPAVAGVEVSETPVAAAST